MSPHLHPGAPGGALGQGGLAGSPPPGPRAAQDVRVVGLPQPPPPQQLQHPRLDASGGLHASGSPGELPGSLGSPVSSRGFDGRPPIQAGLPGLPPPGMDTLSMTQSANAVDAYQHRPVRSPTRAQMSLGGGFGAAAAVGGGSSTFEKPMLQPVLVSSTFDAHALRGTASLPTLGVPASLEARLQQADAVNGRSPSVSSSIYDGQAAAGMGAVMPGIPAMLQQSPVQPPPPPPQQAQLPQTQGSGVYSIPHSAYDSFAAAGTLAQPGGVGSGRMSPPPRRAASVAHIYDERMAMLEQDAAAAAAFFNAGGSGAMSAGSASYGSLGLEHQNSTAAQHAQQLAVAQQHMAQLAHVRIMSFVVRSGIICCIVSTRLHLVPTLQRPAKRLYIPQMQVDYRTQKTCPPLLQAELSCQGMKPEFQCAASCTMSLKEYRRLPCRPIAQAG